MKRLALIALFAAAGCDSGFVEPNPPVLARASRTIVHPIIEEPVIVAYALDLQIPDPVQCRAARDWVLSTVSTFLPLGARGAQLSTQDLAPGCLQRTDRRLDVLGWSNEVAQQRERFGLAHVRPVFVYVNNVDLALPFGLQSDLQALANLGPAVDRPALLYGIGGPKVVQVGFNRAVAWTYATDTRMSAALRDAAANDVPFRSRDPGAWNDALPPAALANAEQVRWCNFSNDVAVDRLDATVATPVILTSPPRVRSLLPSAWMLPRTGLAEVSFEIQTEVCSANCDRFYEDPATMDLTRWTALRHCVAEETP